MQSIELICQCQKQFMQDQINEIEKHKYIESEKAGRDLGQVAVRNWIHAYSKEFREFWFTKAQNL